VGKTMNDVIKDLGLPVVSYLLSYYKVNHYNGLCIYIYPYSVVWQYMEKRQVHNFIGIYWKTPILDSSFNVLIDANNRHKWTPQIADFLKDVVISEIGIVH
jgi:hypothetical protein